MKWFPFGKKKKYHSFLVRQHKASHKERIGRKRMKVSKIFLKNVKFGFFAQYKFMLITIGASVIFLGGIGFIFFSHFFDVSTIIVERNDIVTNVTPVQQFMEKYQGKNIFFCYNGEIYQELRENFPEMKMIQVMSLLPRTLKIKVTEHDIIARIKTIGGEQEMFLNEMGMIRDVACNKESLPLIEYKVQYEIQDKAMTTMLQTYLSLQDRNTIMKKTELQSIMNAKTIFEKEFGVIITRLQYYPIEREVHLFVDKGYSFWIDLGRDVEEQLLKLKKASASFNFQNGKMSYVDLRVYNKIIYCLQGTPCATFGKQ